MTAPRGPLVTTLPHWIFEYLDRVGAWTHDAWERHVGGDTPAFIAAELADVMGFKKAGQGVRATAFSEERQLHRDLDLASEVRRTLIAVGVVYGPAATDDQVKQAITDVAEASRLSEDTIRRAWHDYQFMVCSKEHPSRQE